MPIDYEPYLNRAFKRLVKEVLEDASKNGVPNESHFFFTFQTNRADVKMPEFIRVKYPEEMSIILQHQYDNLNAGMDAFSVTLAFGGIPATLVIPYDALINFSDPGAGFGYTFKPELPKEKTPQKAEVISLSERRKS